MDCLQDVQDLAPELEREVRRTLLSFFGSNLRSMLPQRWLFRTPTGAATLTIGSDGGVAVAEGAIGKPDVTVKGDDRHLSDALSIRMGPDNRPYDLRPVFHTERGERAFGELMRRLGL